MSEKERPEENRHLHWWDSFKLHFYDTGKPERLSGFEIFATLLVCSVIGYCIEMVWCYFKNGYWESRQSLVYGPFGLAYGLGGMLLTVLLFRNTHTPLWKVFLKSFVWLSAAEYIMSLGMELVFGHVSWDYSHMPLNLNGRICALYSCYWGLLGCLWAKVIYPWFNHTLDKISLKMKKILFWVFFVFLVYDCIISAMAAVRFNQRQEGIPPHDVIDVVLDKQFPDSYIRRVFANAMEVDKDGNIDNANPLGKDARPTG